MPHTVRRRVCAIKPTSRPTKVGNVGAVKHGRNTARRPASDHGTVAPGSIDGPLSRGWYRSGRCCPPHTPRSTNHSSPACPRGPRTSAARRNCETRGFRVPPEGESMIILGIFSPHRGIPAQDLDHLYDRDHRPRDQGGAGHRRSDRARPRRAPTLLLIVAVLAVRSGSRRYDSRRGDAEQRQATNGSVKLDAALPGAAVSTGQPRLPGRRATGEAAPEHRLKARRAGWRPRRGPSRCGGQRRPVGWRCPPATDLRRRPRGTMRPDRRRSLRPHRAGSPGTI
jgi:hypothetical protein